MACIKADGSLTSTAKKVMKVLKTPASDLEVASQISFPVYLVRSSLRELAEIGLIAEINGKFELTELGYGKLSN